LKSGEKYLDYSLPWDQVGPVAFTPFDGKPLNLKMLEEKSEERVAHEEGMKLIAEEAQWATERSKHTIISLKLSDMAKRIEEDRKEREKFGTKFRKYQERMMGVERSDLGEKEGKKDEAPNWREEIKQDPYINEAKNIIVDME
jgi:carboxyl-terminal processing protease